MREFDLVDRLRERFAPGRCDTRLAIGDDGALIAPPVGHELAVTTDTLVHGRHYPEDTSAFDIGYKALAVNLSDLAAMAATPAWATVALTRHDLDEAWCARFIDGLAAAIGDSDVDLIGGDTTRGPASVTVTAIGHCPAGEAVRRAGARPGDAIVVTGTLGDAAAGLDVWQAGRRDEPALAPLVDRLLRPGWRSGAALRGRAHAAIDISDGLLADLGHVLRASGVGARLNVDALPTSAALEQYADSARKRRYQLTGGDDYELCIVLPAGGVAQLAEHFACGLTPIGRVRAGERIELVHDDGQPFTEAADWANGWDHFDAD